MFFFGILAERILAENSNLAKSTTVDDLVTLACR